MDRREFFQNCSWKIMRWTPWLGLLGFRFCAYAPATAKACGYTGWVEFCGRLVGFVPR